MSLEASIRQKLESHFAPTYLEIENESHKHSRGGAETHFRLIVVSEKFSGLSRVDRQRAVANLFDPERALGLHALSQRTFTPSEWAELKDKLTLQSPACKHST
ncbi:MAG: BolA family protein [Pseudobdellovibrionaceae bacterium]